MNQTTDCLLNSIEIKEKAFGKINTTIPSSNPHLLSLSRLGILDPGME